MDIVITTMYGGTLLASVYTPRESKECKSQPQAHSVANNTKCSQDHKKI